MVAGAAMNVLKTVRDGKNLICATSFREVETFDRSIARRALQVQSRIRLVRKSALIFGDPFHRERLRGPAPVSIEHPRCAGRPVHRRTPEPGKWSLLDPKALRSEAPAGSEKMEDTPAWQSGPGGRGHLLLKKCLSELEAEKAGRCPPPSITRKEKFGVPAFKNTPEGGPPRVWRREHHGKVRWGSMPQNTAQSGGRFSQFLRLYSGKSR